MGIGPLFAALASADAGVRDSARGALVARGPAAVAPLLAVLADEDAPVAWAEAAWLLRRIGEPAVLPLAALIATAPSAAVAHAARWAFTGLEVADLAAYAPVLTHPHGRVRESAAYAFRHRGPAALPRAGLLLPLLGDPEPPVARAAGSAVRAMGPGVLPLLRDVRRAPHPARARRAALEAITHVGGPAALDERDRAALRRLVRLRRAGEVPAPMHVCGSWFAVRSADQAEVLGAFRLSDPEPVTMGLGAAAWNHGEHTGRGADPAAAHAGCARAYVTPVLDGGWTLVFGPWPGAPHRTRVPPPPAAVRGWCAGLSRRFGAAHWYGQGCGTPWTAWCLAERGRVLRHYDAAAPERTTGAAHPAESGAVLPHEELPPAGPPAFPPGAFEGIPARDAETFLSCLEEVLRALDDPVRLRATDVAARTSVDPASLGPATRVRGPAVLALTACGRRHGHPPGALPV